jgi:hypothetical protein
MTPQMKKALSWTAAIAAIVLGVLYVARSRPEPQRPPLDYSKPIYTSSLAIICPLGLFVDPKADHAPDAVVDLFTSISNLGSKENTLGCTEWRGGLQVQAAPMSKPSDRHYVQINGTLFTIEAHLTNDAPSTQ